MKGVRAAAVRTAFRTDSGFDIDLPIFCCLATGDFMSSNLYLRGDKLNRQCSIRCTRLVRGRLAQGVRLRGLSNTHAEPFLLTSAAARGKVLVCLTSNPVCWVPTTLGNADICWHRLGGTCRIGMLPEVLDLPSFLAFLQGSHDQKAFA